MSDHKKLALHALERLIGPNTYRAKSKLRSCTPEQMDKPYEDSKKTPRQILAEYDEYDKRVNAAIVWLKGVA